MIGSANAFWSTVFWVALAGAFVAALQFCWIFLDIFSRPTKEDPRRRRQQEYLADLRRIMDPLMPDAEARALGVPDWLPFKVYGMPPGPFDPSRIAGDDPYRRAMSAATMNAGRMVIGEIDEDGDLHITVTQPSGKPTESLA